MEDIVIKTVAPLKVLSLEGSGQVKDADSDIDKLFEYIYSNHLEDKVAGPAMALFYTETGGKYVVAIPIVEDIPTGNFKIETLPQIKCLTLMCDSSTVDECFKRIIQYEEKKGIKFQFPVREFYFPQKDGTYKFEIQVPIN